MLQFFTFRILLFKVSMWLNMKLSSELDRKMDKSRQVAFFFKKSKKSYDWKLD